MKNLIRKKVEVMNIKIIGSGGCVSIPRPCCSCKVCKEAREKGFPYARTGSSLFIEGANVLIDTPEDINYALNNAQVEAVDYILYSHMDPDHTMGMRVVEQLRMDWLNRSIGIKNENPIIVGALPQVLDDLKQQEIKYGSVLEYYESCDLIKQKAMSEVNVDDVKIKLISANPQNSVTIFIITDGNKKVIYAPCDVKPFTENELFYNADVLIIGNTIVGDKLKEGFVLGENNPLREELFVMDEIISIKDKYKIKDVIITHLEEDWGKSYDDYLELEKKYSGIRFAYDGMEIH